MKYSFLFLVVLSSLKMNAQNVGVGTTTPAEKLDVNGNINITGTIKTNGVDGTANQVLMKDGSGALSWGDMCDYKNFEMFSTLGDQVWIVPTGVTKIGVEIWGGGGGGSIYCGGGGGGYVRGYFTVVPGSNVNLVVGAGGIGSATPQNGLLSSVHAGPNALFAFGGFAGGTNVNFISIADGGHGDAAGNYRNYVYIMGSPGQLATTKFITTGTNNYEITEGGRGGDGANTVNTGGSAAYRVFQVNGGATQRNATGETGKIPAGGGGAGFTLLQSASTVNGQSGGGGRIIIHY